MRDNIGSREIRIGIAQAGSYQDTLGLGKIANIRGKVGGLWAVPPAESRGRDPGHGYGGKVPPPEAEILRNFSIIYAIRREPLLSGNAPTQFSAGGGAYDAFLDHLVGCEGEEGHHLPRRGSLPPSRKVVSLFPFTAD